jgi:thiol-disulfide isomerase/thioredoxin
MSTRCAAVLALAGFAGFVACSQPSIPATPAPAQAVIAPGQLGSPLPEFTLQDLRGHQLTSADLRGKVILIDFWATWCQPCKKEMPGYQKLFDRFGSQSFAVIGFKFDTMADTENPLTFARKIGVHYPLAIASDELKQSFGGIEGLPTTMIYDRNGLLRQKIIGFEYTEVIESEIRSLL